PPDYVPHVRAIGANYISNASVVGSTIDDELAMPVRVLQDERADLTEIVIGAVQQADSAAKAYGELAANLERAAGGEGHARAAARERLFAALDAPFRTWIHQLRVPATGPIEAELAWSRTVLRLALRL